MVNDFGEGEDADSTPSVVEEIVAAGGEAVADTSDVSTQDGGAVCRRSTWRTWSATWMFT